MRQVANEGLEGGRVGQKAGATHEVGAEGVGGPGADRSDIGVQGRASVTVVVQAEGGVRQRQGGEER